MISNGPELRQVRLALGWSEADLARALRLAGADRHGEKRVREMEAGSRPVSGPITVAMEAFLRGFVPYDFQR